MYALKSEIFPSFFIILMGTIDAITTAIGVLYFGAVEINPLMIGIVNSNIMAFLVLKIFATLLIGFSYILAKRTLNNTLNKETYTFRSSSKLIEIAYTGLMLCLIIIVINNITVLLA